MCVCLMCECVCVCVLRYFCKSQMFDIEIPGFVWTVGAIVLLLREGRYWIEMILEQDRFEQEFKHQCSEDAKDHELSEAVKHMYS